MRVAKPCEMAEIDRIAIEDYGIPGIILMENAALSVVNEVREMLGGFNNKKIIVFAGKGNNGGDAFAVARHLHNKGALVNTFFIGEEDSIKGDAKVNLQILCKMGLEPLKFNKKYLDINYMTNMMLFINEADIIIDGILGTGLKGEVSDIISDVIKIINESGKTILSIDIPSGINGSTGEIMGICVKANRTVTFGLPKAGLLLHPGCEYTGKIVVSDIGIPSNIIDDMHIKNYMIDEDMLKPLICKRKKQTNKGDYGRIFIITGSPGMTGAGCLAGRAALKTGAGLVYLGVPSSLAHIYNSIISEAITINMQDYDEKNKSLIGYLAASNIYKLNEYIKNKDVVAIGPGLSLNEGVATIVNWIVENLTVPLVIDADALNIIACDKEILNKLKTKAVITPHPGEMSRLTGLSIEEIQKNRIEVAKEFAHRWKVITVLKGWRTVVALPDGTVFINVSGNPGMATAGAGDALTGIIASLIGQGLSPEQAAIAGVFLHGTAGDRVANKIGEYGIIAGDIIDEIPYVMYEISNKS